MRAQGQDHATQVHGLPCGRRSSPYHPCSTSSPTPCWLIWREGAQERTRPRLRPHSPPPRRQIECGWVSTRRDVTITHHPPQSLSLSLSSTALPFRRTYSVSRGDSRLRCRLSFAHSFHLSCIDCAVVSLHRISSLYVVQVCSVSLCEPLPAIWFLLYSMLFVLLSFFFFPSLFFPRCLLSSIRFF